MSDATTKFKLILQQGDESSPQLSVKVQLSAETILEMAKKGVRHAFLLLITAEWNEAGQHYFNERRQLLRLEECIAFMRFEHPATFHIFGIILYSKRSDRTQAYNGYHRGFMEQTSGDYSTTILQRGKFDPVAQDLPTKKIIGYIAHETVEVTEDFFAKPPPKWFVAWVDGPYSTASRDSCQLKKRSMLAFTVQPVVVLVLVPVAIIVFAVVSAFWLLLLQRVGNLSEQSLRVSEDWEENSFLLTDSKGNRRAWVSWQKQLLLMPMSYVVATMIGLFIPRTMHLADSPSALILSFLGGTSVVLSIYVLAQITVWCMEALEWRQKTAPQELPTRNYAEVMTKFDRPLRLRDMPMTWATVTLYYQAAKHKLCRPYAR